MRLELDLMAAREDADAAGSQTLFANSWSNPTHLFAVTKLWIEEMNYQEIGNHTKVTEFILVGLSEHPTSQSVLFWTLMFLYIVTLAGNSMIIFLVGVSSQLHTPMYFFLGNLSLLDLLFSTSAVPLIMVNSLQNFPTISYTSCFVQLAIRAFLALAECFLLAIMAYDRFIAISDPLRYRLIMSVRVCILMALIAWVTGLLLTIMPILLFPISFCGHNAVNHFSCEVQAIFKLLCSDTFSLEVMMMVCAVISMPVPLLFILISYLCILRAVLRINPTEARLKAFSTCGSHLVVVTIYFGTLICIYVRPQTKEPQDGDKIVSIFYAAVTPMLNPLIYTLRNKEVKAALRKVTCGVKS
ncbi:olfactory receptor 13H1-like [Tupaia chinensis]|uniref:olfactory receptor 13H1-like n=1 Tax=Tupaia chinensis TaxID=246437 RepID=UPI000703DC60|nr:olfactory receptor 13H1-like [Tupaia chinensis]